jgi:hypothetical protein
MVRYHRCDEIIVRTKEVTSRRIEMTVGVGSFVSGTLREHRELAAIRKAMRSKTEARHVKTLAQDK